MNSFSRYIAKHISPIPSSEGYGGSVGQRRSLSSSLSFAILGIAIGLTVMLLSVAIVIGFKEQIQNKISDFGGHMQVLAIASNRTFEKQPICYSDTMLSHLRSLSTVEKAEPFITKPAVLKTTDDFLSIVVRSGSDTLTGNNIVISQTIANKMHLSEGDQTKLYFVKSGSGFDFGEETAAVKSRTVTVAGCYQSHFNGHDSQVIFAPFDFLQKANGWDEDMASGIEIRLHSFEMLDEGFLEVIEQMSQNTDRQGTALYVQSIEQLNPQIFGWLDLLDTNVWVILGLMIAVASFTMTSGLLIIILERTAMIGLLKALGATNWQLQKIFLYVAARLTMKGLFWGNLIGLGLCLIQYYWHPITLDAENYYLDWVPISLNLWHIAVINAATLAITLLVLLVPSTLVAHIEPSRAIQSNE